MSKGGGVGRQHIGRGWRGCNRGVYGSRGCGRHLGGLRLLREASRVDRCKAQESRWPANCRGSAGRCLDGGAGSVLSGSGHYGSLEVTWYEGRWEML